MVYSGSVDVGTRGTHLLNFGCEIPLLLGNRDGQLLHLAFALLHQVLFDLGLEVAHVQHNLLSKLLFPAYNGPQQSVQDLIGAVSVLGTELFRSIVGTDFLQEYPLKFLLIRTV